MVRRLSGGEDFGHAIGIAFGFLKHGKLIGPDGLVLVDACFHVPASKVAAIGARESAGAETADGCALPKTVIDVAAVQSGLFCPGGFQGLADRALPGGFRDVVVGASDAGEKSKLERDDTGKCEPLDHINSSTMLAGKAGDAPKSNRLM